MKKIPLNKTDIKILSMALNYDDRVQNHYSKEMFNCHYLSDYVSKLRMKLSNYFNEDGFSIIETETHYITKSDGTKATIGIYRISKKYYSKIRELVNTNKPKNKIFSL
ncbi:hypothetical protein Abu_2109 [Aliarcobacter butzleri RM4018]|uniref:Uncharacterized protein n=1 Tax=Aliarcobacter butzleri (strain RM4018) TaxID=367737 RepID=A8EWK0_ALIB4|nr:hypothetical protein [Aliarcobacter butzleri]ABV68323.1 hypothetical protein Abu_2109 [Aliarcobacter butzleri RM4018]GGT79609.1 hypothetical protein GCM10007985_15110 [Aliarcobacter butzleri]SNV33841.1 Uncharacterised protein [Aliarcobacter butzleri]